NLINRSGRLDVKLALEIASQVAAGLAAVHEQHLIHRDIKPTNIMVRLKEEGSVTAKIIDLGLAKTLDDSASQAGISSPGAFVGTPEFESPEQFGGVSVDIRSDLLLARRDALGDGDRPCDGQGFPCRGDVSTSAPTVAGRTTRRHPTAARGSV